MLARPAAAAEEIVVRIPWNDGVRFGAMLAALLALSALAAWMVVGRREQAARKRTLEEMRASEARLRAISDNSPSFIYLGDTSSGILSVNKAYERFYGVKLEVIVGDTQQPWLGRETLDRLVAADREVVATRRPVEYDYETTNRNGVVRYLRALKFPVLDADGNVEAIGGIASDVTESVLAMRELERQKQELERQKQELERQKSFFETLVANIPARVSIKDMQGRYIFASRMLCESTGRTPEEVIGKTAVEAFGISPQAPVIQFTREALETGKPILGIEVADAIHEGRFCSTSFVPIAGPQGKPETLLTIALDVTQARQHEAQLQQAQKMEAVGQLTGGFAHDFNNLLMVILGNLEALRDRFANAPDVSSLLSPAIDNARRGAELIRRLLAFSRRQAVAPVPVDPIRLISDLLDMLRRTLGATIDVEFSAAVGGWSCRADPAQMESAILNLAINARDAMPDGGKLKILTRNVHLDEEQAAMMHDIAPGDYVVLSVADTGTGISRENIARVFEPFFTTKEADKGSGLGLSMVYGFARQSGGHATIRSEPGLGTEVEIYLPRETGATVAAPAEIPAELEEGAGETVLVVDDIPDVRKLVVSQLRSLGYETLEAGDAATAHAVAAGAPRVDLLLTDIVLPGGASGFALGAAISAARPEMTVLYMSGYADETALREGVDIPPENLLVKPFGLHDLAFKARDALRRKSAGPELAGG